ncbi:MAG: exosortase C-terminal domain/associated protein EpsI [Pseudomonadota bacterium]
MIEKRSFIISCAILIISLSMIALISNRGEVALIQKRLHNLPLNIDKWQGIDLSMANSVVTELDADEYINRQYFSNDGDNINLYIGYYGTRKGGRTGHNPDACLPSQGWSIIQEDSVNIPIQRTDQKKLFVTVTRLTVKQEGTVKLIYHWYQSQGGVVLKSGIQQNIDRFWKRLRYNRNDGAFIQVTINTHKSLAVTDSMLRSFIKDLYLLLNDYWPIETSL